MIKELRGGLNCPSPPKREKLNPGNKRNWVEWENKVSKTKLKLKVVASLLMGTCVTQGIGYIKERKPLMRKGPPIPWGEGLLTVLKYPKNPGS